MHAHTVSPPPVFGNDTLNETIVDAPPLRTLPTKPSAFARLKDAVLLVAGLCIPVASVYFWTLYQHDTLKLVAAACAVTVYTLLYVQFLLDRSK